MTSGDWALAGVALVVLVAYEAGCRRRAARGAPWPPWRRACGDAAVVLLAVAALPPLATGARGSPWAETLQFSLLAFGAAPLGALGAPWPPLAALGVRRPAVVVATTPRRGWAALAAFVAVTLAWRLPPAVDALASGPPLPLLEAATVVPAAWWFFTALLGSPPWPPVAGPVQRILMSAAGLWSTWVFAYVVGFSPHPFYPAYAGGTTPLGAQQWVVAILWAASALCLVPNAFAGLVHWLRAEQSLAEADGSRYRRALMPRPPQHGDGLEPGKP